MWKDIREDTIFSDFIISAEIPSISVPLLEEEILDIRNTEEGEKKSNAHGFHSPTYDPSTPCNKPELTNLQDTTIQFTNAALQDRDFGVEMCGYQWWVNINKQYSYNNLHHHGRCDVIGVYYVKLPKDSGSMTLMRNDGSSYTHLFSKIKGGHQLELDATPGRLYIMPGHLWHFVDVNECEEDRISISFNLFVEHKYD